MSYGPGTAHSDSRGDDGLRRRATGKAAILRVIHQEPAFAEMFIAHLLGRTIRVEADLVDQLFNSSEKRLARLLLLLANFGKDDKPEPMIAKISQETLAEMIGTTRSRVSFFMNKFRKLGFIHYNGGIQVHSSLLISFCTRSRTSSSQIIGLCGPMKDAGLTIGGPLDVAPFHRRGMWRTGLKSPTVARSDIA